MKRISSLILLAALAAPVISVELPSLAEASTVLFLDDAQIVGYSSDILHGTITHVESFWVTDGQMLTKAVLHVEDVLKTSSENGAVVGQDFVFYTRGGTIGDLTQTVSGELIPVSGTEVVIFLERIARFDHRPMLLGLRQGAFIVQPDISEDPEVLRACLPPPKNKRIARNLRELDLHPNGSDGTHEIADAKTLSDLKLAILKQVEERP